MTITAMLGIAGDASVLCGFAAMFFDDDLVDPALAIGNGLYAIQGALQGNWVWSAIYAAIAIFCALAWNGRRRNRKRQGKKLGAKSRALLASLVRSMRERAQPRPVLRPVPGGVG